MAAEPESHPLSPVIVITLVDMLVLILSPTASLAIIWNCESEPTSVLLITIWVYSSLNMLNGSVDDDCTLPVKLSETYKSIVPNVPVVFVIPTLHNGVENELLAPFNIL